MQFVLKSKSSGLYFAGWDTLGDNPWECVAKWTGLRDKAIRIKVAETCVDWSNTGELSDCKQVEIP